VGGRASRPRESAVTKKHAVAESAAKTATQIYADIGAPLSPVAQVRKELEHLRDSVPQPFGLTLRRHRRGESLEGAVTTAYVNRHGPYRWFCVWRADDKALAAFTATMGRLHACFPNLVRELNGASWLELVTRFGPAEQDFSTAGPILTLPIEPIGLSLAAIKPLRRAEAAAVCYGALVKSKAISGIECGFHPDGIKGNGVPVFAPPVPLDNPDWLAYRAALKAIDGE
jgi:hypothetical protein